MNKYFLHDGKNHSGPFSISELREKRITKDSLIWYDGIASWTNAADIQELSTLFILIPPPLLTKEPSIQNPENENSIINNTKKQDDLMVLFLGSKNREVGKYIFGSANLKKWGDELNQYVANLEYERQAEIKNINTSPVISFLDEAIAFLCSIDKRDYAITLYENIMNKSYIESSDYVGKVIFKYNIDMTSEYSRIEKEIEEYNKKDKISGLTITTRIIASIILIFITSKLFEFKRVFTLIDNMGFEGFLFKKFAAWISNFTGQPNFFSDEVALFITILVISYSLKTVVSFAIHIRSIEGICWAGFGLLCILECLAVALIFGLTPFWDFVKFIFFLQILSFIIGWLLILDRDDYIS